MHNKHYYTYTPDFYVELETKKLIVEIKYESDLQIILSDDLKRMKLQMAKKYCHCNDLEYRIITEKHIRKGSIIRNIKYLFHFSKYVIPSNVKMSVQNFLMQNDHVSIDLLSRAISTDYEEQKRMKVYIYGLLYNHFLDTDMLNPISNDSIVNLERS